MKQTSAIGLICAVGTLLFTFHGDQTKNLPSLRETHELYVRSIQKRDLTRLASTITEGKQLHFIGTTGEMMKSREDYLRFHQEWFRESDWEISFAAPIIHEVDGFGYTMSVFTYRDKSMDGNAFILVSYVTLIFQKETGRWRVVADVCTPIRREIK